MAKPSKDEPKRPQTCPTCGGSGQITVRVVSPNPGPPQTQTCPSCHGSGVK